MKAKNKRHAAILELIKSSNVETQEDLALRLSEAGIAATQATISRDIKELHLVKGLDKNTNRYKYEQRSSAVENPILTTKTVGILRDGIVRMNIAQNLLVIKCYSGMAQAVCEVLDGSDRSEIVGTLAGENTIFIATESEDAAVKLKEDLYLLVSGSEQ